MKIFSFARAASKRSAQLMGLFKQLVLVSSLLLSAAAAATPAPVLVPQPSASPPSQTAVFESVASIRTLNLRFLGRVNPAPGSWLHPAGTAEPPVRGYDPPASRYGAGHRGVNMGSPAGQILAPADGVVSFVGVVVNRKVLTLDHGAGYKSSFEPIDTDLQRGERVSAGAFIGTVGEFTDDGAHCSGSCFHWGVRLNGEYVNPLPLLGGFAPSVLLPVAAG
ncbi:M23 family metallopeptidase [Micrococcoides hystricis]|uniref:M23 family metallopeptidase n=1 Tax=Micrococcoides hystricis TaxID=1572761 RepID=A0ABV6P8R4_9MICC